MSALLGSHWSIGALSRQAAFRVLLVEGVGQLPQRLVHASTGPEDPSPDPAVPGGLRAALRGRTCACGHAKKAHQHYRRGTDCAMCSCSLYRNVLAQLWPWRR